MYAADAGMSPRDLAAVLGGIATIESRFGVAREVPWNKICFFCQWCIPLS